MKYTALLEWAAEPVTGKNSNFIEEWYSKLESIDELDALAIWLAESFVDGEVKYDIASVLFNQIMPVVGFEEAPRVFWLFYDAFEDFEISEKPDEEAVVSIRSVLATL